MRNKTRITNPREQKVSSDIEQNYQWMKSVFNECMDVSFREIREGGKLAGLIVFIEGLVESETLNEHVITPFLQHGEQWISTSQLTWTELLDTAIETVLAGDAVLFVPGKKQAVIVKVRGGLRRSVEEPASETVIRGPREGLTENLQTNVAMIRFKIKSTNLKTSKFSIGKESQTTVVLSWIEGIADPAVIEEVKHRLRRIDIDAVLESGYIEEMIEDQPFSPFPQLQYSERPDTVAAQLLEGRFAIFTDGTPFVLMGPVTVWQLMQASEDYYERYMIGTLIRWLRFMFIFIALFFPAIYIAVITFHQDMLPTNLLLSVAAAREAIPFPALVEALIMEVAFEALREAGIRLPKAVGQAVSILGALVIGQAAVEAGIVSAPMVIVVSLTGIASFTIPRFNLAISIRMLRFPLMILAGIFGLFGIIIGTVWISNHLCSLKSFGVPYLSGIMPFHTSDQDDIFVRSPWWSLLRRSRSISGRNRKRMPHRQPPSPKPSEEPS